MKDKKNTPQVLARRALLVLLDAAIVAFSFYFALLPQKNESLELEGLTTAVDSMLIQVKFDNTLLSNSLARAFPFPRILLPASASQ